MTTSGGLRVGLNPYGLTYTLGLQALGTDRANPRPGGVNAFLDLADEIGAQVVELHNVWLDELGRAGRLALGARLEDRGLTPVVSASRYWEGVETVLDNALDLGARTVRLALSAVLCGDRAAVGPARWARVIAEIQKDLAQIAPQAADHDVAIAIENHQDFGSAELVAFCEEAGDAVGITFDIGNAFAVAESPLAFARTVAPRVRHVHLKDYRVQFAEEGYRLVRCAIGDGAVPFREVLHVLLAEAGATGRELTASIEPGALEARYIRVLTPEWWRGYAPRDARDFVETLRAAGHNRLAPDADFRTPWEREAPADELIAYEHDMLLRSAANLRALGLMGVAA